MKKIGRPALPPGEKKSSAACSATARDNKAKKLGGHEAYVKEDSARRMESQKKVNSYSIKP